MSLILITGPQAVGKMTIGEELERICGIPLFHNHMSIEFVLSIYKELNDDGKKLSRIIRDETMKSIASSNLKGMIFTYVIAYEKPEEFEYIESIKKIFINHDFYFIELESDLEVRLERNATENRLSKKASKRNLEWSMQELVNSYNKHRLNSFEGEIKEEKYLKINNTNLSPKEVVEIIVEKFPNILL